MPSSYSWEPDTTSFELTFGDKGFPKSSFKYPVMLELQEEESLQVLKLEQDIFYVLSMQNYFHFRSITQKCGYLWYFHDDLFFSTNANTYLSVDCPFTVKIRIWSIKFLNNPKIDAIQYTPHPNITSFVSNGCEQNMFDNNNLSPFSVYLNSIRILHTSNTFT